MIRQFQPEDAFECCELIHACLEKDSSLSFSLRKKMRSRETPESMNERSRLFYISVYESEEGILGVAGLDMNEIRLLYVSPKYQHRGIGFDLLKHLQAMVPAVVFPDIFVYSSVQAIGFYKACGFAEKGPFCFDLEGETLPVVFMTLPIGS